MGSIPFFMFYSALPMTHIVQQLGEETMQLCANED